MQASRNAWNGPLSRTGSRSWAQVDITRPFRNLGLARFFLFLYLCALFAHQKGEGIDALLVRGTFFAYVAVSFFTTIYETVRNRETNRLFTPFLLWLLVFWMWAYCSVFWSSDPSFVFYQAYINNVIQILFIVPLVLLQTRSRSDVVLLLKIVLFANLYSEVLLFANTPSSAWGTERVGDAIGVQFNSLGMRTATAAFISLFLFKETKNPLYIAFIIPSALISFFSGSRKAFLILVLSTVLFLLFVEKGFKAVRNLCIVLAIVVGLYTLVMTNDDLYQILGKRIDNLLGYFMGEGTTEYSTLERAFYRDYAMGMWAQSPIVGWGFNQFAAQMQAINYSHVAYSHCNYTELLSCLGIVGFALYYGFYFYLGKRLVGCLRTRKDSLLLFGTVLLVVLAVMEYGFVAFVGIDEYLYLLVCYSMTVVLEGSDENRERTSVA